MNDKQKIEMLKNELWNYPLYEARAKELKEDIYRLRYKASGDGARPLTKVAAGKVDSKGEKPNLIIQFADTIEAKEQELDELQRRMARVEWHLSLMQPSDKKLIRMIYFEGKTYEKVAVYAGYSVRGLQKKIDKAIKSSFLPR